MHWNFSSLAAVQFMCIWYVQRRRIGRWLGNPVDFYIASGFIRELFVWFNVAIIPTINLLLLFVHDPSNRPRYNFPTSNSLCCYVLLFAVRVWDICTMHVHFIHVWREAKKESTINEVDCLSLQWCREQTLHLDLDAHYRFEWHGLVEIDILQENRQNVRSMPIISSCFYTHRSSTAVKMVFNMYGCHGSHGYGRTHRAQRPTANARNGFIHLMCAVARCIYLDIIQSPCSCSCSIILYAPVKPSGVDLFFAGGLCNAALVNFT